MLSNSCNFPSISLQSENNPRMRTAQIRLFATKSRSGRPVPWMAHFTAQHCRWQELNTVRSRSGRHNLNRYPYKKGVFAGELKVPSDGPLRVILEFHTAMSLSDSRAEAPPAYSDIAPTTSEARPNISPPIYTFPTTFVIGPYSVNALVTPEQLKGHLAILRTFYALRSYVEEAKDDRFPDWAKKLEPERRWAWFVTLAVHR
jgi:hypothetical protein